MSKKFLLIFSLILMAVLCFSLKPMIAKNLENNDDEIIPEEEGVYNVPNHPNLKVRVFVHKEKPTKIVSPSLACNLSDPDSSAIVKSAGWHLPNAWSYTLNIYSLPATINANNFITMANNAFNRWSDVTGSSSKIIFTKTTTNTTLSRATFDGKNIIAWGRTSASALAVTYTWYNKITKEVVEVDTIMNKKFSWNWSDPATWTSPATTCADQNSYDAQNILTHELGHWLGLDDETFLDFVNNTMYGYGAKGEIKKDTLTTGDITAVKNIYP